MTNGRVKTKKTVDWQLAEIKEKMAQHGLTIRKFGQIVGVARSLASQYLCGYRNLLPERYELFMKNIEKLERRETELEEILNRE